MNTSNYFFTIMFVLTLISCKKSEDKSFDFTEENIFTKGIEGPDRQWIVMEICMQ